MKIRVVTRLPRRFPRAKGLIDQADIPCNEGRLRAKLLIFATTADMRRYWKRWLGKDSLGRGCQGVVNAFAMYREKPSSGERILEVDARYFCVIALCRKRLTMRVISHECVHAAYAFAKRKTRSWWDVQAQQLDEEAIAYPAGEIARNIVAFLNRRGHLPS